MIKEREQQGTIVFWTSERKKWNRLPPPVKAQRLVEWACELKGQWQKDVLLILEYAMQVSEYPILKVGTFLDSTVESETYHLHLMKYQPPSGGI